MFGEPPEGDSPSLTKQSVHAGAQLPNFYQFFMVWAVGLCAAMALAAPMCAKAKDAVVAEKGMSAYRIVTPDKASPAETYAASELQTHLLQ